MQYKTYYLLDAEFISGEVCSGRIDNVAYPTLEEVERLIHVSLPSEPTHLIDVNGCSVDEWEQWKAFHTNHEALLWEGRDEVLRCSYTEHVFFTVRAISVPVEA